MSKFVLIQGNPQLGYNFVGEAHRIWPGGQAIKVEVLDAEDDPPKVVVKRSWGPEEAANPTVMGQRSYRLLQANAQIRILSDGESVASVEVAAAKDQAARQAAEIIDLKGQIAVIQAELDAAHVRIAELTGGGDDKPSPDAGKADQSNGDKGKGKPKG